MIIDKKLVSAAALVTTIVITAAVVYAYNSSSDMEGYLKNITADENGQYHGYMIILRYRSDFAAYILDSNNVFDSSFYLLKNNIVFTDLRDMSVAISKINFTFKNLLVVQNSDDGDDFLFLFSTDEFILNIIKLNIFTSNSFDWCEGLHKNGTNEVEIENGRPLTDKLVKTIGKTYRKGISVGTSDQINDNNGYMISFKIGDSFKIDDSSESVVKKITFVFYDYKSQLLIFENHTIVVAKIPYDKIDCTYKNILLIRTDADTVRCILKESEAERFLSNIRSGGNYFDGFEQLEGGSSSRRLKRNKTKRQRRHIKL